MTTSTETPQMVLGYIDANVRSDLYKAQPSGFKVAMAMSPAIKVYVDSGNNVQDVATFNAALIYAIHKHWPTPFYGPLDDKAPPRAWADLLYRQTKDDTGNLAALKADVSSWTQTVTSKQKLALPKFFTDAGLPLGLNPLANTPLEDTTDSITSFSDALANIGEILNGVYDILRWFTDPSNLWRTAKFFIGALLIYMGLSSVITGTPVGKAIPKGIGKGLT